MKVVVTSIFLILLASFVYSQQIDMTELEDRYTGSSYPGPFDEYAQRYNQYTQSGHDGSFEEYVLQRHGFVIADGRTGTTPRPADGNTPTTDPTPPSSTNNQSDPPQGTTLTNNTPSINQTPDGTTPTLDPQPPRDDGTPPTNQPDDQQTPSINQTESDPQVNRTPTSNQTEIDPPSTVVPPPPEPPRHKFISNELLDKAQRPPTHLEEDYVDSFQTRNAYENLLEEFIFEENDTSQDLIQDIRQKLEDVATVKVSGYLNLTEEEKITRENELKDLTKKLDLLTATTEQQPPHTLRTRVKGVSSISEAIDQKPVYNVDAILDKPEEEDIERIFDHHQTFEHLVRLSTLEQDQAHILDTLSDIENDVNNKESKIEEFTQGYVEAKENLRIRKKTYSNDDFDKKSTVISLQIRPLRKLNNVTVFEEIPKEIVENASDIIFFDDTAQIVNPDPLIVWHFTTVDQPIDLYYEVPGEVDDVQLEQTQTLPVSGWTISQVETTRDIDPYSLFFPILFTLITVVSALLVHRYLATKDVHIRYHHHSQSSKALIKFIALGLKQGYNKESIRNRLIREGWPPLVVDDALNDFYEDAIQ